MLHSNTIENINPLTDNFSVKNKDKFASTNEYKQIKSDSNVPSYIHINLDNLKCFEQVDNQFQNWGITFSNAIIIEPSNPAFAVPEGVKVLMGGPKNGRIEMYFRSPAKFVSALTRNSHRTIVSAYNQNEELLAKDEVPTSSLLNSNSMISPKTQLTVNAEKIYKVVFYAFDGQFIIIDLSVGF